MERLSPKSARPVLALLTAVVAILSGCSANDAAEERRVIREQHLPDAISWIREDLARASVGVRTAGEQYASVFVLEDAETRERLITILDGLPQAMMVISHDEDFLTRIARRRVCLEQGQLVEY